MGAERNYCRWFHDYGAIGLDSSDVAIMLGEFSEIHSTTTLDSNHNLIIHAPTLEGLSPLRAKPLTAPLTYHSRRNGRRIQCLRRKNRHIHDFWDQMGDSERNTLPSAHPRNDPRLMRLQWETPVHDKEVQLALRWTVVVV